MIVQCVSWRRAASGKLDNAQVKLTSSAQMKRGDAIVFGAKHRFSKLVHSDLQDIHLPSGRKIELRQWWPVGTKKEALPKHGPVVLIVPGLGVKTEYGGAFVSKILGKQPLVYGLDTLALGTDPIKKGHLASRKDLVNELKETIEWLGKQHQSQVYLAGVSLGGLIATHTAAEKPKHLGGVILISPAFKTASTSFKPGFYLNVLGHYLLEKTGLRSPRPIKMPYNADAEQWQNAAWFKEIREQISSLSATSYIELFRMTTLEALRKVRQIQVPTLMLVAGKDTICDTNAMREGFSKIPHAEKKLVEFPDAHHSIILEKDMGELASIMTDWLDQTIAKQSKS